MKEGLRTIYQSEKEKERITLTEEQKAAVINITLGIEEVDETVRSMAADDVVTTLENGHPLNRIINDEENNINGYLACEDFIPREAYIKYFGTNNLSGRNLLKEIPAFLEFAREQGYTKLNFHGWNERLNRVMERYGFKRIRTDSMSGFSADFYEKVLAEEKTPEAVSEERKLAFEKKYLNKLEQDYRNTLNTFSEENKKEKEDEINVVFEKLSSRLAGTAGIEFGDRQKAVLKLKLSRHFQKTDSLDINVLYDAISESPRFLNTDKGSLHRLFEVHEEKTLQKIAELRKQRAEIGGEAESNPYENMFMTDSGNYYVARLLNMPHLERESEYMDHCVGTSDSYINRIKRGEIEILSFRLAPKVDPETGKTEGDTPVITIEYDTKDKMIRQMKKKNDEYLKSDDPYFNDLIDALKQLRTTATDTGETRDFSKIEPSELQNIKVKDYHILTERGEIDFRDFNPSSGEFILKMGNMEITPETSKEDAAKIMCIVENIDCKPEEIATDIKEVNDNTNTYIGEWNIEIFQTIKNYPNIIHLYESFPDKKIFKQALETDPNINSPEKAEKVFQEKNIDLSDWGKDILQKTEFSQGKETYELVQFTVGQLGFSNGAATDEIYQKAQELGLELCQAEVGPHLRLQYEGKDWKLIAMKQITGRDGDPYVFYLNAVDGRRKLSGDNARPSSWWISGNRFVFLSRKSR